MEPCPIIGEFHLDKSALLGSTAIGLLLCIAPANAQMQQKGAEEKAAPSQQHEPGTSHKEQQGQSKQKAEPNSKDAQGETKQHPGKGTAQTKPSDNNGTAQKAEPQDKASKGTAEKAPEPKDKSTRGTAEKAPAPQDKATKGATSEPNRSGNTGRIQLTEEKRTNTSAIFRGAHMWRRDVPRDQ